MKIKRQVGHQGDTQWFSVDAIPKHAKKVEKQFVAASEKSGSFHALFGNYDQYELPNGEGFVLDVKSECVINHSLQKHLAGQSLDKKIELPKKDHRSSTIKKGLYYVGIQRRFNPLKAWMENVLD